MLTLFLELVNVQLPSLLLGVSVVFSSYLCYHFAGPLASLASFPFLRFGHFAPQPSSPAPLLTANMEGIPLEVFSSYSSSSSPPTPPPIVSSLSSSTSSVPTSRSSHSNLDLSSSCSDIPTTTITPGKKSGVGKAKLLRLGSSMSFAVPLALSRRVWKGAAYSSWSVGFEVQHEMGQALIRNHHRFSLVDLCQLSADFAADPPANLSSIRTVYCGGIRADLVQYHSPHRPDQNQTKVTPTSTLKSSGDELHGKAGSRSSKKHSHEDGSAEPSSKLSKSTPITSQSTSSDERTKVNMRRIKSESDNLGRAYQFTTEDGEEDTDGAGAATVLYLHGGGFCVGSATTYRKCLWHFSREMKGLRFLAVDYSLSPHVRFPTALQECLHAYLWLIDENGGNVPADKIILAGDSAGGCLVLALLFLIRHMRDEAAKNNTRNRDDQHSEEGGPEERSSFADSENERTQERATIASDEDEEKEKEQEGQQESAKLPFKLPSRKVPPQFPLCAFLMSPWVDLSEASSVMKPESYAQPATYQAQMSLARRFIDAYLGTDERDQANNKNTKKKTTKKQQEEEQEMKEMKKEKKAMSVPDVRSPFISPLYGDLRGLPPLMLTAGSEEPLVADIEALYAKCVEADLEVEIDMGEHMNHAYQVFHDPSSHREIERSLQAVGRFVWRNIAKRQMQQEGC